MDEWVVEEDGLHRTCAGEDSSNDKEEGSLVVIIATVRLDGLSWLTLHTWDDGHRNNDRGGGGHRDSGGRGGGQ